MDGEWWNSSSWVSLVDCCCSWCCHEIFGIPRFTNRVYESGVDMAEQRPALWFRFCSCGFLAACLGQHSRTAGQSDGQSDSPGELCVYAQWISRRVRVWITKFPRTVESLKCEGWNQMRTCPNRNDTFCGFGVGVGPVWFSFLAFHKTLMSMDWWENLQEIIEIVPSNMRLSRKFSHKNQVNQSIRWEFWGRRKPSPSSPPFVAAVRNHADSGAGRPVLRWSGRIGVRHGGHQVGPGMGPDRLVPWNV